MRRKSFRILPSELQDSVLDRTMVALEIVCTERDYVRDLETVVSVFLEHVCVANIVRDRDVAVIFTNIEEVLEVNSLLLKNMEASRTFDGKVFINMKERMQSAYGSYCSTHDDARARLRTLLSESKPFSSSLDDLYRNIPALRKLRLDDFLIMPIQRLCKYSLLLRDLIRKTTENSPEIAVLTQALECVNNITGSVNEQKRRAENVKKLNEVAEALEGVDPAKFIDADREFVRQGEMLKWIEGKDWNPRIFFLFNDRILYCKVCMVMIDIVLVDVVVDGDR